MFLQYIGNDLYEIQTNDGNFLVLSKTEIEEMTVQFRELEQKHINSLTQGL